MQLGELYKANPRLIALGYRILAISPDRPAELEASKQKKDLDYTLLSDSKLKAAQAFGIAFHLTDAEVASYKKYGIDVEAASGEKHHLLPVPSVFLVDQKGVIRYRYYNPNYRIRLDTESLLAAAREALD